MDARLAKIYYSPQGYWKGTAAIQKLAEAKRATDPIWSLKVHQIERNVTKPGEQVVYYLSSGP